MLSNILLKSKGKHARRVSSNVGNEKLPVTTRKKGNYKIAELGPHLNFKMWREKLSQIVTQCTSDPQLGDLQLNVSEFVFCSNAFVTKFRIFVIL